MRKRNKSNENDHVKNDSRKNPNMEYVFSEDQHDLLQRRTKFQCNPLTDPGTLRSEQEEELLWDFVGWIIDDLDRLEKDPETLSIFETVALDKLLEILPKYLMVYGQPATRVTIEDFGRLSETIIIEDVNKLYHLTDSINFG